MTRGKSSWEGNGDNSRAGSDGQEDCCHFQACHSRAKPCGRSVSVLKARGIGRGSLGMVVIFLGERERIKSIAHWEGQGQGLNPSLSLLGCPREGMGLQSRGSGAMGLPGRCLCYHMQAISLQFYCLLSAFPNGTRSFHTHSSASPAFSYSSEA